MLKLSIWANFNTFEIIWGQTMGKENILEGKFPHAPYGTTTVQMVSKGELFKLSGGKMIECSPQV